jgi:hypothetical protein
MVSKKQGMVPHHARIGLGVRVMVFNATFNNILVILLRSVSLVKETGEVTDKLYHIMLYSIISVHLKSTFSIIIEVENIIGVLTLT